MNEPVSARPDSPKAALSPPSPKRVVLWIDEINDEFLGALRDAGVEVAALVQASHPEVPSFSVHDLYYGSPGLAALSPVRAPTSWIDDASFRQYARCVQRVGFHPASDFLETGSGGVMLGVDVEDWARQHLNHALQLLQGVAADEVWFSFNPHLGLDNMLALAAQRTDRPCLVFSQIRFAAKFSWKQLGVEPDIGAGGLAWKPWEGGAIQPNLFYMRENDTAPWNRDIGQRLHFLARRVLRGDWSALSSRLYLGARKRRWWSLMYCLEILDRRTRPFAGLRRHFKRRFDLEQGRRQCVQADGEWGDFIYLPLHLEPEENVHAIGGAYRNQLDAVVALHDQLPPGWTLLLKENPKQSFQHRGEPFDARLAALPNVRFAEPALASDLLLARARLVASITGTAGYEALLLGKPCLYFGEAWYASLPGAVQFKAGLDLVALSTRRIASATLDAAVNHLLGGLADGLAHPRFAGVHPVEALPELYRQAGCSMAIISASLQSEERAVRLRRARPDESELAFQIKKAACEVQVESVGEWDDAEQRLQHARRFATQGYRFAEVDGQPVGMMAMVVSADCVRFNQLFVLPGFQGRGVGAAVYRHVLSEARRFQLPARLDVRKENVRSVALAERMGFRKVAHSATHHHMEALPPSASGAAVAPAQVPEASTGRLS